MVVLIIFPVILQTDINVKMLSIGGQGTTNNKNKFRISWKLQISPTPLSFSTLTQGDPFRIYGEAFQAADGEDLVILACTVFD